ncbi:MAG: pentapeptide repeat-containing protein [Spirochaetales bacterium]|nr:pentapeptide repeat-containing protein [Spirochaetales bacterium]
MIFEGPGNLPLIGTYLEKSGSLESWQLNRGDFSTLAIKDRPINQLSCERALINDAEWVRCDMIRPEFRQCSLERNAFRETYLEEGLFVSCQLREAHIRGSYLSGGVFRGCSAPRMVLEKSRLRRVSLYEPEISRARFSHLAVVASLFTAVHESGVTGIRKSEVDHCLFINCRFNGAFFVSSTLTNSVFIGCRFVDSDWDMIDWDNCTFTDCTGLPRGAANLPLGGAAGQSHFDGWNRYIKE